MSILRFVLLIWLYVLHTMKAFLEWLIQFLTFCYCFQVCCRCSPEQKAQVVRLIQRHSNKTCAAIGDGGNDVSMIQAASAGIGIVGKFKFNTIIWFLAKT